MKKDPFQTFDDRQVKFKTPPNFTVAHLNESAKSIEELKNSMESQEEKDIWQYHKDGKAFRGIKTNAKSTNMIDPVNFHPQRKAIEINSSDEILSPQSSINQIGMNSIQQRSSVVGKDTSNIREQVLIENRVLKPNKITRPGQLMEEGAVYDRKLETPDYPSTALDHQDYKKRLNFKNLEGARVENMCQWKQKDFKGIKKNSYMKEMTKVNQNILQVEKKDELERLDVYTDRFPLLDFRKSLNRIRIMVVLCSFEIQKSKIFNNVVFTVIGLNSAIMLLDDPTQEPTVLSDTADKVFTILYTLEAAIKICGLGFIVGEKAYLKDAWNILDFTIVLSSYLTMVQSRTNINIDTDFNLSSLRAFRVMRPLKTISSVKGLKVLMDALFQAMPLLRDTIGILFFFFAIFAIGGTNLLQGTLKNRCISIQTGIVMSKEALCGGIDCPGGYFCGKTNENPNFGVTNFDNVLYSFLCVFQSVTLEGWSDVQKQLQKSYNYSVFLYFLPLVFVGAFFLLNLTLAVINSEFTKAHKEAQHAQLKQNKGNLEFELTEAALESTLKDKDVLTISQFITARIYAKKMIEFLRMRQAQNKAEMENNVKVKAKEAFVARARRTIQELGVKTALSLRPKTQNAQKYLTRTNKSFSPLQTNNKITGMFNFENYDKKDDDVIQEETAREESDHKDLQNDIQKFLRESRMQMKRNSHLGKIFTTTNDFQKHEEEGRAPKMKGNIGFVNKSNNVDHSHSQKKLFARMAREFDIDKILPKRRESKNTNVIQSMESFKLSIGDDNQSQMEMIDIKNQTMTGLIEGIPGIDNANISDQIVSSESNFELAAGLQQQRATTSLTKTRDRSQLKSEIIKKEVSKTFKRMLRQNNERGGAQTPQTSYLYDNRSTIYDASLLKGLTFEESLNNNEIESKFTRNKSRQGTRQRFAEDSHDFDIMNQKNLRAGTPGLTKFSDDQVFNAVERVHSKRPQDPFKDLDPLTQKVDIAADLEYKGTSMPDVLNLRYINQNQNNPLEVNKFLQLPEEMQQQMDPDFAEDQILRSQFHPAQQKVVYQIIGESYSESDFSDELKREEIIFAQEQPYATPTMINYEEMLKQLPTKELAKRSDIMITSTVSMSIFPKDKRYIIQKQRAFMDKDAIREYIDEKNAFNAIVKEHFYNNGQAKDKDKQFRDAYMMSFIHRREFQSKTLRNFKSKVKKLNSNLRHQKIKGKEIIKEEKQRHQQNINACKKRGNPTFDKQMAKKLLEGRFHESEDDEEFVNKQFDKFDGNKSIMAQNRQELENQHQIENFELKIKNIIQDQENDRIKFNDEIPSDIKKQFNLPDDMGIYQLNFNQVKKSDFSFKKQKPMWSGQDVLPNQLDHIKSLQVISRINKNRVWPGGFEGFIKRIRFKLRIVIKSYVFENLMTFFVILNTVTLSIEYYGIEIELRHMLNNFNTYFTIVFMVEMGSKLLAIGPSKYANDKMNYLDGTVVLLSILELVLNSVLANEDGGLGLDAFKTIRMLRTFRVFRIARLLRALKSMQTIIGVMMRSYKSFIYITLLMFLFIFIFALLGMQTFGGNMNYDDGLPRGNYDSFPIAFITIFQVLTMENWQQVLFDSMRSDSINPIFVSIFYISWIFLGNFILLNLFLAILLDSFLEEDEEEEYDELRQLEKIEKKHKKQQKKWKEANKVVMADGTERDKPNIHRAYTPSKKFFGEAKGESEEDLEDLDEDQVIQIFKDQGIIEEDKKDSKKYNNFDGIECVKALYLFDQESEFRVFCLNRIRHKYWETIVQFLIFLSSAKLIVDTYIQDYPNNSVVTKISVGIDFFFNFMFIFEMIYKIVAMGFVMDEGSYLRDNFNQLDFFIILSSIVDMLATGVEIPVFRILRMLRVLRPLRFINHNDNLKMVVVALLDSVNHIFNVVIVIALMYLIFAILGVNFFGGKFFYCSIDRYKIQTEQECLFYLGQWMRHDFNFDNVMEAMNTLYTVASLEGWPDIMIQAIDMTGEELGPTKENTLISMVFFVVFILIGSFFFLNFFIGVLFMKFKQAQKEEQRGFTKKDLMWQDIMKLILKAEPEYESTNVPKQPWRKNFHRLVSSEMFDNIIMCAIILNMVQMASISESQTIGFQYFLAITNYLFTIIFIVETILKLIAYGQSYFDNSWNRFDFFVVVSSIFDIGLVFLQSLKIETNNKFLSAAPRIARIMRVLRVTRVIRLLGKHPGLQAIIQTIMFSITPLSNVIMLLMLIFFIFSILGNFLFSKIQYGKVMDDIVNFKVFDSAFLLLFSISTGENWPIIMFDCSRTPEEGCIEGETCGVAPWSYLYFYFMVLVCSYVMLNLFILVIIQQFEKYYIPKEKNVISMFKCDRDIFMQVWKKFTQDKYNCLKIKENKLPLFLRELGELENNQDHTMGFSHEFYDDGELKKALLKMGVKSENGSIYFNELLYRCMRRKYGIPRMNKKMQIIELRTQFNIYKMTLSKRKQGHKKPSNQEIYNSVIKKENGVNPFLTIMFFKITFRTWVKLARFKISEENKNRSKRSDASQFSIDSEIKKPERPYLVQIEFEEMISVTSEEEEEDLEHSNQTRRSLQANQAQRTATQAIRSKSSFRQQNTLFMHPSEEEEARIGQKKLRKMGTAGSLSGTGSNGHLTTSKKKPVKDHLKMFERKMTQRFSVLKEIAESKDNECTPTFPNPSKFKNSIKQMEMEKRKSAMYNISKSQSLSDSD